MIMVVNGTYDKAMITVDEKQILSAEVDGPIVKFQTNTGITFSKTFGSQDTSEAVVDAVYELKSDPNKESVKINNQNEVW